jgi:hypothetical protein
VGQISCENVERESANVCSGWIKMLQATKCCDKCITLPQGYFCAKEYIVSDFNDLYFVLRDDYIYRYSIYLRKDGAGYVRTEARWVTTSDGKSSLEFEDICEIVWKDDKFTVENFYDAIASLLFLQLDSEEFTIWAEAIKYFCRVVDFMRGAKLNVDLGGFKSGMDLKVLCDKLRDLDIKCIELKAIYGVNNVNDLYSKFNDAGNILRIWGLEE